MPATALCSPVFGVALVQDQPGDTPVVNPLDAALLFKKHIGNYDREAFAVIMLDPAKRLIGFNLASIGTLTGTSARPAEVFRPAILANSENLILGHNHPSGDTTPSEEDRILTDRLVQAGKLLGIEVLDHIVVAPDGSFFSFQENSLIGA